VVALRGRRDTGAGLVHRARRERSTTALLGGPAPFALRTALPTSLGWAVGLAVVGATIGAMLPSLEAYLEEDPGYAELLAAFGVDIADISGGFLSMMGVIGGVALCLRVAWRVGAARAEEDSGRLEQLLVRPLPRWRWLAGHVVVAAVDAVLLALVTGAAAWAGAVAGGADVSGADAVAAMVNPLPVVAVFLGLAVALQGVAPRLVVGVTATVAMVLYVVELVGPPLDWPEAVVAVSPFHLELVPVDPFGTTAALVLVGVGVALGAVGFLTFARRDLVGG
jgi:ABC-2 type transport system permease protein